MEYQVCCKCNLYINITSYVSHTNSDLNLIINKINIYSKYEIIKSESYLMKFQVMLKLYLIFDSQDLPEKIFKKL